MTNHHHGPPDDEFRNDALDQSIVEAMRAEIPAPASGYLDRIDRNLARIADESAVRKDHLHAGAVKSRVGADTATELIRLTSMKPHDTKKQPFGSRLLARAAILLVFAGLTTAAVAAIVVTGDDDTVSPAATSPSTTETTSTTEGEPSSGVEEATEAIAWGPFTRQDVFDAGWEGIGCWMHPDADLGPEVLFFMGWDGGFVMIDGTPVEMANTEGQSFGTTDDVFAGVGYRAEFVEVGDPTPSSIESTVQDVVLRITADDGRSTDLSGVLWCGN